MNSIVCPAYGMKRLIAPTGFPTEENPQGSRGFETNVASVAGDIAPHSAFNNLLRLLFERGYAADIIGKGPRRFGEIELAESIKEEMEETIQNYKGEVNEACRQAQERHSSIILPFRIAVFDIPESSRELVEELLGVGNFQYAHAGSYGMYIYRELLERLINEGETEGLLKGETVFERYITHESHEKAVLDVLEKFERKIEKAKEVKKETAKIIAFGSSAKRGNIKNYLFSLRSAFVGLTDDLAELGISQEDIEEVLLPEEYCGKKVDYADKVDNVQFSPDTAHRLTERARNEQGNFYASLAPVQPIIDAQKSKDIETGLFAARTEKNGYLESMAREAMEDRGNFADADIPVAQKILFANTLFNVTEEMLMGESFSTPEERLRPLFQAMRKDYDLQRVEQALNYVLSFAFLTDKERKRMLFTIESVAPEFGFTMDYSLDRKTIITLKPVMFAQEINVASTASDAEILGSGTFYSLKEKILKHRLDELTKEEKALIPLAITQITVQLEPMVTDLHYLPDYLENKALLVDAAVLLDKEGELNVGVKSFFNNVSKDNISIDKPVIYIIALEDSSVEKTREMWDSYGLKEGDNEFCKIIGPTQAKEIAETYASKRQTSFHQQTFKTVLALVSKKFPNRIKWQAPLPETQKTLIGEIGENEMALTISALRGNLDLLVYGGFTATWEDRFRRTLINNGIGQMEAEEIAEYVMQGAREGKGLQNINWVVPIPQPNYQLRQDIQQMAQEFKGKA